jgi:hypothetical protein
MQKFNLIKPEHLSMMVPMGTTRSMATKGFSSMGRMTKDYRRLRTALENARKSNLGKKVISQREKAVKAMENLIYKYR